jgi:hypothetical protein
LISVDLVKICEQNGWYKGCLNHTISGNTDERKRYRKYVYNPNTGDRQIAEYTEKNLKAWAEKGYFREDITPEPGEVVINNELGAFAYYME